MPYCAFCGKEISDLALMCPGCGHPGPAAVKVSSGPRAPFGSEYAEWWQRLVAFLIDNLIVNIPTSFFVTGLLLREANPEDFFRFDGSRPELTFHYYWIAILGPAIFVALITILYRTLLDGSERGQTVGKMVMKIQVRDAEHGGPIGYARAFVRWLVASLLNLALFFPGLIDGLFPLWDPKRQAIHDKPVRSVVVKVR